MNVEGERTQRERLRDLAVFERVNGNPTLSSPSLAVKKVGFHLLCSFNYSITFENIFIFFIDLAFWRRIMMGFEVH